MYAHYFSSKTRKYLLITSTPDLRGLGVGVTIDVTGKTEARRIAAERGAKCWNF